jgi:hypothetical protein
LYGKYPYRDLYHPTPDLLPLETVGVACVTILFVIKKNPKFARATPNPEGDRQARVDGRRLIEDEIRMAKSLEAMNEGFAFFWAFAALGCSSIAHWWSRFGG